ncbi:hypothetical protein [Aquabacterium sp.]|uniref:hypothetical protein n=1 Tax=Aquabacterium sp. TaxID=1872578 RepID=UPI003D6D54C8
MNLQYLDFEHSEDTEGIGTFEAMASVSPDQVPQVHAEIRDVLNWAFRAFPEGHGPVSEGGVWDHDLQSQREYSASDAIEFDERSGQLRVQAGEAGLARHTLTLSISGTADFCAAFLDRFKLAL